MPIRWSAPEVVLGSQYTSASDVWSFFVLMWEVWSGGQRPFGEKSNILICMILEEVKDGDTAPAELLPKPDGVTDSKYGGLQELCWAVNPSDRASFETVRAWAQGMAEQLDLGQGNAVGAAAGYPRVRGRATVGRPVQAGAHAYPRKTSTGMALYGSKPAGAAEGVRENAAAMPYQTKLAGAAKTYASKNTRARRQPDGQAKYSGIVVAAGGDVGGNTVSGVSAFRPTSCRRCRSRAPGRMRARLPINSSLFLSRSTGKSRSKGVNTTSPATRKRTWPFSAISLRFLMRPYR